MAYDADLDSTHNPASSTVAPASWGDLINGNFAAMGAWTSYSPAWTTSGTDPAIGNGVIVGQYQRRGDFLVVRILITMGSTTTYGNATWLFGTPVLTTSAVNAAEGSGQIRDDSDSGRYPHVVMSVSNTAVFCITTHDRTVVDNNSPIAWATGDTITLTFIAEAA